MDIFTLRTQPMANNKFFRLMLWIKEESIRIIPAIIYFTCAFNLIYFTSGLTLKPDDIRFFTPLGVTIGAFIVGKVLIIANAFPFINAFVKKPLIYSIVWKFLIYSFFILVLWMFEVFYHSLHKYDSLSGAIQHLKSDFSTPIFWSTELWLSSVFLIFIVFSEFARVLGKKKIQDILFFTPH